MPRWSKIVLGVVAGVPVLAVVIVLVMTQTDYGRRRVRQMAVGALASSAHGVVKVGPIHGNLLTGATIDGLSITDSTGAPFFRADTVGIHYSLLGLLRKRVELSHVRLVRPVVVLDRPPGLAWNFSRIFPSDTTKPPTRQGFGAWINVRDLTVVAGRVLVKNEWQPPDTLRGEARRLAVRDALSPDNRMRIVRVPKGYQSVQDYRQIDAHFDRLRLAHPDSAAMIFDVSRLALVAYPFRPPAAVVRNLSGTVVSTGDTLIARGLRVALPGSQLTLDGTYLVPTGALDVAVAASRVAFPDLRFAYPPAPAGGGSLQARLTRAGGQTHVVARRIDLSIDPARLTGYADVAFGDTLLLGPTDLRFSDVDTRLVHRVAPGTRVPVQGVLNGRVALRGAPSSLQVDGNVTFRDRTGAVSRLVADGRVGTGDGFQARNLRLRFAPVQLSLASAMGQRLPVGGAVTGEATLTGSTRTGFDFRADLAHRAVGAGRSHVTAAGAIVRRGEEYAARDLRMRLEPLQLALVRAFRPDLAPSGALSGTVRLDGTPGALTLAADLTHESAATGRSHVVATGGVGFTDAFRARDLRVRMDPLQLALVGQFEPDLPVDGFLTGHLTLNGSTAGRLAARGDVTHEGSTGTSTVAGTASVPVGGSGAFAVDVRATPLSLATVGRFAPSARLHGSATGGVHATGTMRDLAVSLGLAVQDGGSVSATGTLDLASATKTYDVSARFDAFDAHAVTLRAPVTSLSGTAAAAGRGTDPAVMNATLSADLSGARVGSAEVDTVGLRARLSGGLAMVDRATVRLASAQADARGSFGLVAGKSGTLSYRVRLDTLSRFAGLLPSDTARVVQRPLQVARAIAQARADSIRIAKATEVERAATGSPPEPKLQVDTTGALPADSLSGSLDAMGTLSGNVERFDVQGTATMRDLVAIGSRVGSGRVSYRWLDAPTPQSELSADAALRSVVVRGFAADSVGARVRYAGLTGAGDGTLDVAVVQDPRREYRARADFSLAPERKEVRYSDLSLRFDTTTWTATHPASVSWAGGGVELDDVELTSNHGGRILADGRLPANGPAELRLQVQRLQVGDVLALVQDSTRLEGLVSLDASVEGTGASPVIQGTAALAEAVVDTVRVPDVTARIQYADRALHAQAQLTQGGRTLAVADARLPIDLAISGVTGPRLPPDAPLSVDVRADSIPLESLPSFTTAVSDIRGRLAGTVSVRGTRANPRVRGVVTLDLGSLRVTEPGLALTDIGGTVHVDGDSAVVDSLVARSGGGDIRITGGLDLAELTRPGFDLHAAARDAAVLNNEYGRLAANVDLTVRGPWTGTRVSGDVEVLHGVINAPETGVPQRIDVDAPSVRTLGDTAALALVATNPLLANLRVDVAVRVQPDTWVRNSQANVEIYTPEEAGALAIHMDRAAQALTLEGTVNTDRGEYTFAGRRIRLTHGAVVFRNETPLNPILQLTAEQEVRLASRPAFDIQLLVGGTLRAPKLVLESNAQPPIAESDLLSYFAFGEPTSSLLKPETGGSVAGGSGAGGTVLGPLGAIATQQLGATAVGIVVDQMELQTRQAFGLDVFNITPAPLPPELALQGYLNVFRGAQFEAGKYLTNRWYLAGKGRTAAVLPGLQLQYRTPNGFEWLTSWEPRYLAGQPSLVASQAPATTRELGFFVQWLRRF
ncbi:MAG TPA: translocation/assembly module TamB domain-containing protein [Longimicrobiaceae bacterium]|nr:translocation/assembly module TamB domain-containing protein [Longimicrobiaceae bacterium]